MKKEQFDIEKIDRSLFEINVVDQENPTQASFTHYLQNHQNGASDFYKKDALVFVEQILKKKHPRQQITNKLTELVLQRLTSNSNKLVPFPAPKNPKFRFIDLFAGIGGFRIAMQNLGGKCVYTSEWNKDAQKTYKANYGEIPFGDITKEKVKKYIPESYDIVCAGFPCQAFSIAGYRKGFSDTRGTLFFDVEQIVERNRPKAVFLENVKNLLSHDKGKTFKVIVEILEKKLGYKVFYEILNSMTHANVPQNRERVFIVAFEPKQVKNYKDFKFPKQVKLTKTIHDIIDGDKKGDKYYYSKNHMYYPKLSKTMNNKNTVYQWRRVYVRENKSNVCPTLTANMGTGGHNVPLIKDDFGIRKLTPKECFAFQGFEMSKFIFPKIADSKLYMQAGNSVTVSLIERITKEIIKIF
tara:strand:+ start:2575 stop:3807 length:1233 start_codon:yes stop_codon:yes gene_type:complete